MSEAGEYTPPEWPRFLFQHGGPAQQFDSQADADATGTKWYRTQEEADKAAAPARGAASAEGESDQPAPRRR